MRIKVLLFALLLLVTSINTFGQNKSFVSLSVGPAVPLGGYASTEFNYFGQTPFENHGFAKTGFNICLDGSKYLSSNIGLSASIHTGSNSFNTQPYYNLVKASAIANGIPNMQFTFKADPYNYFTFLAGPTFGFSQDKVSVDFRTMLGFAVASYSKKVLSASQQVGQNPADLARVNLEMDAEGGTALAVSLGGTLRYNITENVGVIVRPEMLWWKLTFNETTVTTLSYGSQSATETSPSTSSIPFSIFTIGFGVAYQFNK